MNRKQFSLRALLAVMTFCAISIMGHVALRHELPNHVEPAGWTLKATGALPEGLIYWFTDTEDKVVTALLIFGDHPTVMISGQHGNFSIPELKTERISLPRDGAVYILSPDSSLVQSKLDLLDTVKNWKDYPKWGSSIVNEIEANTW